MVRDKLVPVLWLFCCAVIIGASLGLAARAGADPVDDRVFIETLDEFDVPYESPAAAIRIGLGVCEAFTAGASLAQVVSNVVVNVDLSPSQASYLTGAAVGSYCDEFGYLFRQGSRLA